MTKIPPNTNATILVKIGHEETKVTFPLKFIFPETTTERPGFVSNIDAIPVVHIGGSRVVIIRPDTTKNTDLIGNYAITINSPYPLPSDQTEVRILSEGPFMNQCFVVGEEAICRSHFDPVTWEGSFVP